MQVKGTEFSETSEGPGYNHKIYCDVNHENLYYQKDTGRFICEYLKDNQAKRKQYRERGDMIPTKLILLPRVLIITQRKHNRCSTSIFSDC